MVYYNPSTQSSETLAANIKLPDAYDWLKTQWKDNEISYSTLQYTSQ